MAFILKFENKQKVEKNDKPVIRIDADAYNALIDMSNNSNYPLSKIASEAIKYASKQFKHQRGDVNE